MLLFFQHPFSTLTNELMFFCHITEHLDSYEEDGFGRVCNDYTSTVSAIVESIRDGAELGEIYRARIDAFFAFDDRANSRRVYEALANTV